MADDGTWKQGDTGTYTGIMEARRGQAVECVLVGELISFRFPDGFVCGCAAGSVKR